MKKSFEVLEDGTLKCYSRHAVRDYMKTVDYFNFDSPVIIDDSIENCMMMFSNELFFNQPVTIPEGVKDCYECFAGCENLNSKIILPQSLRMASYMFENCVEFNQELDIPMMLIDAITMFKGCAKFNQPVYLLNPNVCCTGMLTGCTSFNSPVVLSKPGIKHDDVFAKRVNNRIYLGIDKEGFEVAKAQNTIVLIPKKPNTTITGTKLFDAFNTLASMYPEDSKILIDAFLKIARMTNNTESLIPLLNYKNKNNLYETTSDYIKSKLSLGDLDSLDDDDVNGETNLF